MTKKTLQRSSGIRGEENGLIAGEVHEVRGGFIKNDSKCKVCQGQVMNEIKIQFVFNYLSLADNLNTLVSLWCFDIWLSLASYPVGGRTQISLFGYWQK